MTIAVDLGRKATNKQTMTDLFAFSVINMGEVKLSTDKYLMAIYLSLGKYKLLLFPYP